jgi:hypothetical protein
MYIIKQRDRNKCIKQKYVKIFYLKFHIFYVKTIQIIIFTNNKKELY